MRRSRFFGVAITIAAACALSLGCDRGITPEESLAEAAPEEVVESPLPLPSITVPDDLGTIQGAIDAATAGGVILVEPGEYRESLRFKDGITLMGESRNTAIVTCDATTGPVLTVRGCPAGQIMGLTFAHTGAAAPASAEGGTPSEQASAEEAETAASAADAEEENADEDEGPREDGESGMRPWKRSTNPPPLCSSRAAGSP